MAIKRRIISQKLFDRGAFFKLDESKIKKISCLHKVNCKDFDKQLSGETRNKIFEKTHKLNKLNKYFPENEDPFVKHTWSLRNFDKINLPIIIGHVNNKKFSSRGGSDNDKYLWIMDFPIKMPYSQIKIPTEFSQFTDFFRKSIQFERMINPDFEKCYANLCIDQRPVSPNGYQRRPGWHADSFITKNTHLQYKNEFFSPPMDTVYLAYDRLATEFNKGTFGFTKNVNNHSNDEVLDHFDKMAKSENVITFPNYTILKMDSRCVHRVQMNSTNESIDRTFLKLTFTTDIFNRLGNDQNYLFDYNWPLFQRTVKRNNSSLFNGFFDESQYKEIEKEQLERLFLETNNIDSGGLHQISNVFEKQQYKILKVGNVRIQPTYEGELLLSDDENNTFITYNTAKIGDYKITNLNNNTQYFLSTNKVNQFYDMFNISKGVIKPKQVIGTAIKIKKYIKLLAPWNAYQYLHPGDYIIKKSGDIYGIKESDFLKCYRVIS